VHTNYNYKHVDNTNNDLQYDSISLCRSYGNPSGSFAMVAVVRYGRSRSLCRSRSLWLKSFTVDIVVCRGRGSLPCSQLFVA
jgi:hypothetical protein